VVLYICFSRFHPEWKEKGRHLILKN